MILKSTNLLLNEKLKKSLGYTRSKFNIAINEPNSAVCYRTKTLDGFDHSWDDENIRILKTSAGSGGQFFAMNDIEKFADAVMKKAKCCFPKIYLTKRKKLCNRFRRRLGFWLALC